VEGRLVAGEGEELTEGKRGRRAANQRGNGRVSIIVELASVVTASAGMGKGVVGGGGSDVAGQRAGTGASTEKERRESTETVVCSGRWRQISAIFVSSGGTAAVHMVAVQWNGGGEGDKERSQVQREERRGARIEDRGGGAGQWPMWRSIGCSIGTFAAAWYVEKCTGAAKLCKKGAIEGAIDRESGG